MQRARQRALALHKKKALEAEEQKLNTQLAADRPVGAATPVGKAVTYTGQRSVVARPLRKRAPHFVKNHARAVDASGIPYGAGAFEAARARLQAAKAAMNAPSDVVPDETVDMSDIRVNPHTKQVLRGPSMTKFLRRKQLVEERNRKLAQLRAEEQEERKAELERARAAFTIAQTHHNISMKAAEEQAAATVHVTAERMLELTRAHQLGVARPQAHDTPLVSSVREVLESHGMDETQHQEMERTLAKLNAQAYKLRELTGEADTLVNGNMLLNARRFTAPSAAARAMLQSTDDEAKKESYSENEASFARATDVIGSKATESIRNEIYASRTTLVRGVRHAHPGTIFPIATIRPPMGQTKPLTTGKTLEAPVHNDFVPVQGSNATGMTMVWAIRSGISPGTQHTLGARLHAKVAKHPGIGKSLNLGLLFSADGVESLRNSTTKLNPVGLSVSICQWNPSHGMFDASMDETRAAPVSSRSSFMTVAELEGAEESQYLLVVHVPQDTKPGRMFDTILRNNQNVSDDMTVQWDTKTRSMRAKRLGGCTSSKSMTYSEMSSERIHNLHLELQHALAQQMAEHLCSSTGSGDLTLDLFGDAKRCLGVVQTDGWTQFRTRQTSTMTVDTQFKAVYCSNVIPVTNGSGVVPIFKGPGEGFHVLSAQVRLAKGGVNADEDTKIVPATAGRLVGPDEAMFMSMAKFNDKAKLETVRQHLRDDRGIYLSSTRAADDLSRELVCYFAPGVQAYNDRKSLDQVVRKYTGEVRATPAVHIATCLL